MSVIVRHPDGRIQLFSKGADSVIYPRLADTAPGVATATQLHVERFAAEGLRTLLFAARDLDPSEWEQFKAAQAIALQVVGHERDAALEVRLTDTRFPLSLSLSLSLSLPLLP